MRVWAERTVDVTAELVHRVRAPDGDESEFEKSRRELLAALSSQIDKGRFYFPNMHKDKAGHDKEPAYQGIRQYLLDDLVEIFDIVQELSWEDRGLVSDKLAHAHRLFVSRVQELLDPSRRDANYREITDQYKVNSPFVADALRRADAVGRPGVAADSAQPKTPTGTSSVGNYFRHTEE
jgi:hypothetical protein